MTRAAAALLSVLLLSTVSCQSDSPDVTACDIVDEIVVSFEEEDLDGYSASAQDLAMEIDDVEDQLLSDVGTSLYIVALQWRETGYEDEQLRQANALAVDLLGNRCEELRG